MVQSTKRKDLPEVLPGDLDFEMRMVEEGTNVLRSVPEPYEKPSVQHQECLEKAFEEWTTLIEKSLTECWKLVSDDGKVLAVRTSERDHLRFDISIFVNGEKVQVLDLMLPRWRTFSSLIEIDSFVTFRLGIRTVPDIVLVTNLLGARRTRPGHLPDQRTLRVLQSFKTLDLPPGTRATLSRLKP